MFNRFCTFLFLVCFQAFGQKSGIKGLISDQKGEPIPFASIGVEKQPQGTMANQEGRYQLELPAGQYKIYFQCIGYQTIAKEITVSTAMQEVDVNLQEVSIQMKEVTVASRNEDPAYSIMRKAIARAKINKLLVDSYKARVYIRGSGRVLEVPFLLRSVAKSNGFDENTVFFTETLENLEFKQPNTYKEVVIAARSTAGNVKIGQQFIKEDLYSPNYGSTISPLSPASFRSYKFQYLGAFTDRGYEVFKIKVIPRQKGERVWEGEINIIDQLWCIHSAKLSGNVQNIETKLSNLYAPVQGIWMPVQVQQDFKGKLLGISFEAKYNSSLSQYQLVKNEKLYTEFQALEQKIDEKTNEELKKPAKEIDLVSIEKQDKKLMKQIAKAYVKEKIKEKLGIRKKENKKLPEPPHIETDEEYTVDSNAFKKDSVYWEENRDVPLTVMEVKSFHKLDSIRVKRELEDSTETKKSDKGGKFGIMDAVMGYTHRFGKPDSLKRKPVVLKYFSPIGDMQFNAVEGYAGSGSIWLKTYLSQSTNKQEDDRSYLQFGPTMRYSFGRKKLLGSGVFQYASGPWEAEVSGGTEMRQVNNNNPIATSINSLYALTDTRNFIKLYEQDFLQLKVLRKLTSRLEVESSVEWANRIPVRNSVSKGIWGGKNKSFASNDVDMPFVSDAETDRTVALRWTGRLDWYPTLTGGIYNGVHYFNATSSPRIRLLVTHALPGIAGANIDYTLLSGSILSKFLTSEQSDLTVFTRASGFVRKSKFGQMDAAQVLGNQTLLLIGQSVEAFRNLPYYQFSSQRTIAELHLEWLHKRLLLGWIFRKKTWQEVVIAKGLANEGQPSFYELGYGIDQLFRFIRVELIRSQLQGYRPDWSFRVGFVQKLDLVPSTYNRQVGMGL